MDKLKAMQIFTEVVEAGSFAGAARALRMSPPAVTRAVASLEMELGARLLERSTRAVRLSVAGRDYLFHVKRILEDVRQADLMASGAFGAPKGLLRVTAPAMFGQYHVIPVINAYLAENPETQIDTLFVDRVTRLVEEGLDVGIRIGELADSAMMAVLVGNVRRLVCAAPDYLERAGIPETPADLVHHTIVAATASTQSDVWTFGRDREIRVAVKPRLYCNSNNAAVCSARLGLGLTRVLSYQAGPEIAAGSLRTVLDDYAEPPLPVHVVHASGRQASASLRTFVDMAVEKLRAEPVLRLSEN